MRTEALLRLWSRYEDACWDAQAAFNSTEGDDKLDRWGELQKMLDKRARIARWLGRYLV